MFYIVKLGDKKYYSKEFVKNVRKLGDAGIVREIEKGTLKTRKILSMVVYELDDKEVSNINLTEAGVQTQEEKPEEKDAKVVEVIDEKKDIDATLSDDDNLFDLIESMYDKED